MDEACLFHGGKLSFGNGQLVRVQSMGIGKNWWARVSEKMVVDKMARGRGGETIGIENIWKF